MWILWIDDPLLDLPKKKQKSVFGFGNPDLDFPPPKNAPLVPRAGTIGFECEYYTILCTKSSQWLLCNLTS